MFIPVRDHAAARENAHGPLDSRNLFLQCRSERHRLIRLLLHTVIGLVLHKNRAKEPIPLRMKLVERPFVFDEK
ncbi:MAG: hypothetical protein ALAOOOJD_03396 [bacterium]|nr:hypothetical protein [bacterium]